MCIPLSLTTDIYKCTRILYSTMENKTKLKNIETMTNILNERKKQMEEHDFLYYGRGVIHTLWICDIITDTERRELKEKFGL